MFVCVCITYLILCVIFAYGVVTRQFSLLFLRLLLLLLLLLVKLWLISFSSVCPLLICLGVSGLDQCLIRRCCPMLFFRRVGIWVGCSPSLNFAPVGVPVSGEHRLSNRKKGQSGSHLRQNNYVKLSKNAEYYFLRGIFPCVGSVVYGSCDVGCMYSCNRGVFSSPEVIYRAPWGDMCGLALLPTSPGGFFFVLGRFLGEHLGLQNRD